MKRIGVLTGTRAEFWLLKDLIDFIEDDPILELVLITTGMHYDPEFGRTIDQIKETGISPKVEIEVYPETDDYKEYAATYANIAKILNEKLVDELALLIVLGDRIEAFAGASIAAIRKIPVAHLHGGEVSGNIDDTLRHAITKLSYFHFTSTRNHALRVERLGENKERIFNVGAIGYSNALKLKSELSSTSNPIGNEYVFVVLHPESTPDNAAHRMELLLSILTSFDLNIVIIDPNSDPGGRSMQGIIKKYQEKYSSLHRFQSLPQKKYFEYLYHSSLLIGNSSSGIIEAHALDTVCINLGKRQRNRDHPQSVIHIDWDKNEITKSIKYYIQEEVQREILKQKSPYDAGDDTNKLIFNIIKNLDFDNISQKRITY